MLLRPPCPWHCLTKASPLSRSLSSDVPGSEVKIEFLSSKGQAKKLTLRRMKVEAIADKHQMFHLFTEVG
jgi:hypothetical protein